MMHSGEKINIQSKTYLARLLALEGVQVVHSAKSRTASFNLKTRVVTLPILKNMNDFVYDAFIAHEISHALHTPLQEYQLVQGTGPGLVPGGYINITEDARIEKLIQRKYPGTKQDFRKFYEKYSSPQEDFFQIIGKDLSKYKLIDRINLHFKIGNNITIPFKPEEQKYIDMVAAEETFNDAYNSALQIYEYDKEQQKKNKKRKKKKKEKKEEESEKEQEQENEEEGEDEDSASGESTGDENEENESDGSDQSDADGDSEEDDEESGDDVAEDSEDDGADEEQNADQQSGSQEPDEESETEEEEQEENKQDIPEAGHTQQTFDNNLMDIYETSTKVMFSDINDGKDFYKQYIQEPLVHTPETVDETLYNAFMDSIRPVINMMVAEFNMRKSANEYYDTKEHLTGRINPQKVCTYKINDDIFLSGEEAPESKNHGMIMFVDWSGSMTGTIFSVFKQIIVLTEFCRKINIPYEVWGFTTQKNLYGGMSFPAHNGAFPATGIGETPILFKLFDSQISYGKYKPIMTTLFNHLEKGVQKTRIKDMSYTPLYATALFAKHIVEDFKRRYRTEKNSLILLSDGAPTDYMMVDGDTQPTLLHARDKDTGKTYTIDAHKPSTWQIMFKYLKDTCQLSKMIGFYLTSSADSSYVISDKKEDVSKFKYDGFTCFNKTNDAFDKFYMVSPSTLHIETLPTCDLGDINKINVQKNKMIFMREFVKEIS